MPIMYGSIGLNVVNGGALGTNLPVAQGPAGEMLAAEIHGKYYAPNRGGNVFFLATAAAGTTVPVQASNLVSTFTIWNPIGSGKNIELIRYSYAMLSATAVVSDISLYVQPGVGQTVAAPGTLTLLTIRSAAGAGATPTIASVCTGYSAATLVNVVGTNIFRGPTLLSLGATAETNAGPLNYDFDGSFILPPGTIATTAGTAAQSAAGSQFLSWAEWPV
jgi:hypothetical protein